MKNKRAMLKELAVWAAAVGTFVIMYAMIDSGISDGRIFIAPIMLLVFAFGELIKAAGDE